MGAVKKGDRVRVVLEGEVASVHGQDVLIDSGSRLKHVVVEDHVVSIEVLKPPVERFKPGDRLRRKDFEPGYEITLADEGYLQHFSNGTVHYFSHRSDVFNSDSYELVVR